ncbi:MAG: cyclophilin-like fold protein [Methanomethylophilus sp.]|jgi:hypothetical protein
MLKLLIRARSGDYNALLDESDISSAVWFLSSPEYKAEANQVSGLYYFELPIDPEVKGERATKFEAGDICWWPKVNALVIFYGPTPLSGDDQKPVWKYPLVKIGHIEGECASLDEAGDRQNMTLVQKA